MSDEYLDNIPSAEEIKAQIEAAEAHAAALRAELQGRKANEKADVISDIKLLIADYGIVESDLFAKKPERKKGTRARVELSDTVTGEVFRGGKPPRWLKDRMNETGLAYPDYRDRFMVKAA